MQISTQQSILHVGLSRRVANALYRNGVKTLGALASIDDLNVIHGIGSNAIEEINKLLCEVDLISPDQIIVEDDQSNHRANGDCSPYLSNSSNIMMLPLSARTRRNLYRSGVRTTGDLLSTTLAELEMFCGLGKTSIAELEVFLRKQNGHVNTSSNWVGAEYPVDLKSSTETDLLEALFSGVAERNKDILSFRYGLNGQDAHTLQETGESAGVTRERVRQICKNTLRTGIRRNLVHSREVQHLIAVCTDFLNEYKVSTTEQIAKHLDDHMQVRDIDQLISLLNFLNDEVIETDSLKFGLKVYKTLLCSTNLNPTLVSSILITIQNYVQDSMAPISVETLVKSCAESFPENPPDTSLVQALLEYHGDFVQVETGEWGLEKWRKRLYDDLVLVLRELGRPAHFTEITDMVNTRLPENEQTNSHAVHAQLGRYTNLFIRTDSGTFGLREHFPDAPVQPPKYVDLIEEVLEEAGVPLSVPEVHRRVDALREAKFSSMMLYLGTHEKFMGYGNGMYGLARWGFGKEKTDHGYVFTYCPIPLLPNNDNSRSFFESVIVGRNLLIERPELTPEQFYQEMLNWADQTAKGVQNTQAAFDVWYAAGLLSYVDVQASPEVSLKSQIPADADLTTVRIHCLNNLCQSVQKMPELLSALDRLPLPTVSMLQKVVFGSEEAGFDVPLRVSLLMALEAVRKDGRSWHLTDLGQDILAANQPTGILDFTVLDDLEEEPEDNDWDDTLDIFTL